MNWTFKEWEEWEALDQCEIGINNEVKLMIVNYVLDKVSSMFSNSFNVQCKILMIIIQLKVYRKKKHTKDPVSSKLIQSSIKIHVSSFK